MEEILILLGLWGLFVTFGVPVLAWQALQSANRANDAARQLSEKLDALDYRISNTSLSSAPQNSTPEAKTGTETLRAPIPTGSPASSRADDPVPDPIPTGPISVSASAPSPETAEAEPPAAAFDKQRQFNPDALLRGRGIVILGAITLGLGSILLVRHGIDAGWFSPIFRLMLGGLGGFGLIAGGEWLRRHPGKVPNTVPAAHAAPSGLVAGGVIALLATLYSAHALYGYLPTPLTYGALAGTVLLGALMALRHGPIVAVTATIGGFVIPFLTQGAAPAALPLAAHIFAVTAMAMVLTQQIRWMPLAVIGLVGSSAWTLLLILNPYALEAASSLMILTLALGLVTLRGIGFPTSNLQIRATHLPMMIHASLTLCLALETEASTLLIAAHMGAALLTALWVDGRHPLALTIVALLPLAQLEMDPTLLWLGLSLLPAACALGRLIMSKGLRRELPLTVLPPLVALLLYGDAAAQHPAFLASLLVAGTFSIGVSILLASRHRAQLMEAASVLVLGTLVALSYGAAMVLQDQWFTVALATPLPLLAFLSDRMDRRVMRLGMIGLMGLLAISLILMPSLYSLPMAPHPLGGWVMTGFGLPILSILVAWWLVPGPKFTDLSAFLLTTAILMGLVLAALEFRLIFAGRLDAGTYGLVEQAANASLWLATAFLLLTLAPKVPENRTFTPLAALLTGLAIVQVGPVSLVLNGPLDSGAPVGTWPIFNLLLVAYALPSIAVPMVLRAARRLPIAQQTLWAAPWVQRALPTISLALSVIWLSLEIKRAFQGPYLTLIPSDGELLAHTIAWLVVATLMLLIGWLRQSLLLRGAALLMLLVVTAKVFLVDLAGLEGVAQAASFIGLGLVLIGMAVLAQRVLRVPQ